MRRLIAYLSSLLLGVILGMIFVATVHSLGPHRQEEIPPNGIAIGCEILGAEDQKTVLLIAGPAVRFADWSTEFCGYRVDQGYHASFSIIAISVSLVRPAR